MIQLGYTSTILANGDELKTWIFKGRKCSLQILRDEHFIESGRVENLSEQIAIILNTPQIFMNTAPYLKRLFGIGKRDNTYTVTQIIREVAI